MDLTARLSAEMKRRRARHPRHSLRALARGAGMAHTTLLRLMREGARLTPTSARRLGLRLGWTEIEIAEACRAENERRILRLVARPGFRPDSRWLAVRSGLALDDVNVALQRLLQGRRLTMQDRRSWSIEREVS